MTRCEYASPACSVANCAMHLSAMGASASQSSPRHAVRLVLRVLEETGLIVAHHTPQCAVRAKRGGSFRSSPLRRARRRRRKARRQAPWPLRRAAVSLLLYHPRMLAKPARVRLAARSRVPGPGVRRRSLRPNRHTCPSCNADARMEGEEADPKGARGVPACGRQRRGRG